MNDVEVDIRQNELSNRLSWFIRLRWFAIFATAALGIAVKKFLVPNIQIKSFLLALSILAILNIIYFFYNKTLERDKTPRAGYKKTYFFAKIQITLDLLILTLLFHFSGSVENPFVFFYIFHIVIASILLLRKDAFIQAIIAMFLFLAMVLSEYFGFIPHFHLFRLFPATFCLLTPEYIIVLSFALGATLFLTVFLATSITIRLRESEGALSQANKQLGIMNEQKSRYVMTVSHDIRASLGLIQSCLYVVLNGMAGSVSDKAIDMLSRAGRRTKNLLAFVGDLLNLATIRAGGSLKKEQVDIAELIKKVYNEVGATATQKNIKMEIGDLPDEHIVSADRISIEHIFENLVGNALKYTETNGTIGIDLKGKGDFIEITVWDSGIGIPKEEQKYLFQDFFRAKNAKKIEGTGLGLAIVKQLVEKHNGYIRIESQRGQGTKVIFTLPLSGIE